MSRLFQGDIVEDPKNQALSMILRAYNPDEPVPPPHAPMPDGRPHPFQEELLPGQVQTSLLFAQTPASDPAEAIQVYAEADLVLVDRLVQPGDAVKRVGDGSISGIVKAVEVFTELGHIVSGQRIEGKVSSNDLEGALKVEVGDRVIASDWVGVIEEIFEEGTVETMAGELWRVADMGAMLDHGRRADELFPPGSDLPPLPNPISTAPRDPATERVVHVQATVVYVNWSAISQKISISLQAERPKPKPYWSGTELNQLSHVTSPLDHLPQVGSKVSFRSRATAEARGLQSTKHGHDKSISLSIMTVLTTETYADVLWQDNTVTRERTTGLLLHLNVDEYDAWPGDHVVFKGPDGERTAVVQRMNTSDRTAEIKLVESQSKDIFALSPETLLVSVLELDPHGQHPETFGVARGDIVLIGSSSNGCAPPRVPRIGEFEEPLDDPEQMRSTMTRLGMSNEIQQSPPGRFDLNKSLDAVDWYGEVADLRLDGLVEIVLPNGRTVVERMERLSVLNEAGDRPFEGDEVDEGEEMMDGMGEGDGDWVSEDGSYIEGEELVEGEVDAWESMDDEEEADMNAAEDSTMLSASLDQRSFLAPAPASPPPASADVLAPAASSIQPSANVPSLNDLLSSSASPTKDDPRWQRFAMLEEAPDSHHFYANVGKPNAAFVSRLQKEFKVLASSLPDTILVRTYEDRMDLIRVLILGPPGTPYHDAPHLIDFWVNPAKYPFEPPVAHFHSWTRGMGRCNPNLYEDGKVCLSVLNTWQGDKSESWLPQKSSLLQTFVSIQGLVLIREPYFNEPGFEKLRGTAEATVNSRQYSEKAYVLSRAFVLHALQYPIDSFEEEIQHFYITLGKLDGVLDQAQRLVTLSEREVVDGEVEKELAWDEGNGVGRLTKGGMLPLKRTLDALQAIRDSAAISSTA